MVIVARITDFLCSPWPVEAILSDILHRFGGFPLTVGTVDLLVILAFGEHRLALRPRG